MAEQKFTKHDLFANTPGFAFSGGCPARIGWFVNQDQLGGLRLKAAFSIQRLWLLRR